MLAALYHFTITSIPEAPLGWAIALLALLTIFGGPFLLIWLVTRKKH